MVVTAKFPALLKGVPLGELAANAVSRLRGYNPKAPLFGGAGAQSLRGFSPILLHYIGSVKPRQV